MSKEGQENECDGKLKHGGNRDIFISLVRTPAYFFPSSFHSFSPLLMSDVSSFWNEGIIQGVERDREKDGFD